MIVMHFKSLLFTTLKIEKILAKTELSLIFISLLFNKLRFITVLIITSMIIKLLAAFFKHFPTL